MLIEVGTPETDRPPQSQLLCPSTQQDKRGAQWCIPIIPTLRQEDGYEFEDSLSCKEKGKKNAGVSGLSRLGGKGEAGKRPRMG